MLKIYFGRLPEQLKRPDSYLDRNFEDEWFLDPFVQRICKEVDGTIVHSAYQMENPVFGPLNVLKLSMGCKNTILAYKTDKVLPGDFMGDNCAPLLCEIAKTKDVTITLKHIMDFQQCKDFEAYIINIDKVVHGFKEFNWEAVELV